MRYIRTEKNGIVDREYPNCFKSHGDNGRYVVDKLTEEKNLELWLLYNHDSIIKESDTIEELCDSVVVKYSYESLPKPIETLQNNKLQMINALKDNKDVQWINLAIWTNKGLTYVAEMKGILSNGEIDWKLYEKM